MFKNKTASIKFPKVISFIIFMAALTACHPHESQIASEKKLNGIVGGKPVNSTNIFSKRIIYLALGVKWEITPESASVSKTASCTASALSPTVLITAAHCVSGLKPSEVNAVLSNNPFNHDLILSEWIKVTKIIMHEKFLDKTKNDTKGEIINDIALLQLAEPLPLESVSKLAFKQFYDVATPMVAIGYGRRSTLMADTDSSIDDSKEGSLLFYVAKTTDDYDISKPIFTVSQADQSGICNGDSGGPALIFDSKVKDFSILGITSYVSISDEEQAKLDPKAIYNYCIGHGNYTNVLYYADWISRNMSRL